MIAILAPGQGAQTPGFLEPWLAHQRSRSLVQEWSALIDLDLIELGVSGDADLIRKTSHAQPLLVAAGIISQIQLMERLNQPGVVSLYAGHSVGEITAAAMAQVIDSSTALSLVNVRARAMSAAASSSETGMSAVLGGERGDVLARLAELGLTAANENGAGQIVAAGPLAALTALNENPPAGSRVRSLAVSGAFHTSVMSPAVEKLAAAAAQAEINSHHLPVLSNKDGAIISDGQEIISRIVGQVAAPVRWDLCMESLVDAGVTGVIEVAPGGTLTGLLKRAQPEIQTFAIKTPDDLQSAIEFASAHQNNSRQVVGQ